MKPIIAVLLTLLSLAQPVLSQTSRPPQQEAAPEDVVRIATSLVQTDLVVTDQE